MIAVANGVMHLDGEGEEASSVALEILAHGENRQKEFAFVIHVDVESREFERDGKRFLPLAIQVHHAVCDGYHVGMFVERLQGYVDNF